jgi:hypothetical protein
LQDAHVGHATEFDQTLRRTVQLGVEELLRASEGGGIGGCVDFHGHS